PGTGCNAGLENNPTPCRHARRPLQSSEQGEQAGQRRGQCEGTRERFPHGHRVVPQPFLVWSVSMEHTFERRFKTRLTLETLESRMQPGSLLLSGAGLASLGDQLSNPDYAVSDPSVSELLVVKHHQDDSIHIVSTPQTEVQTNNETTQVATTSSTTSSLSLDQGSTTTMTHT